MIFLNLILLLVVYPRVKPAEWFTNIEYNNDKLSNLYDETIITYKYETPFRLKCIQKCILFDSSCQFFKYNKKKLCTIYSALKKSSFLYGRKSIYLREKKLPRIHFTNGSFFNHNQLVDISRKSSVNLSRNSLSQIAPYALQEFSKTEILDLTFNNLSMLYSKSFYAMKKLNKLLLSSNQISLIERDVFQDISNSLKYLDLGSNLLTYLDANMFANLQELEFISLDSNKIEQIEKNTFKSLKTLGKLNLYGNKLKFLDTIFFNLSSFLFLDISANQISIIHNDTFRSLNKLRTIFFYYNQIKKINCETFKGAYNLERLYIGNNKLEIIDKNLPINFPNLKDLHMSYNNLSFIETDFFNGFLNLEILILIQCFIKSIDLSWLAKIKILNLSLNKVNYFSQNLSSLVDLNLSSNPLSNLTYQLINSQNSSLEVLDISFCQLKHIDFNILKNFTYLKILKIRGNFDVFDENTFKGFKSLETVHNVVICLKQLPLMSSTSSLVIDTTTDFKNLPKNVTSNLNLSTQKTLFSTSTTTTRKSTLLPYTNLSTMSQISLDTSSLNIQTQSPTETRSNTTLMCKFFLIYKYKSIPLVYKNNLIFTR
ncbi:unnamed protein product, partial [Brachionus calyciflorus]